MYKVKMEAVDGIYSSKTGLMPTAPIPISGSLFAVSHVRIAASEEIDSRLHVDSKTEIDRLLKIATSRKCLLPQL